MIENKRILTKDGKIAAINADFPETGEKNVMLIVPREGRWRDILDIKICSECGEISPRGGIERFCPHCGAIMVNTFSETK